MKTKKKRKITVIDIILLCVVLASIYALYLLSAPEAAAPGDTRIHYTVELFRYKTGFAENVVIGEELYDIERGYHIGTIISKYEEPYLEDAPDIEAGRFKRAEVEGLVNVYVVVEAYANITENATNIGQYQVMVGKEAFVKSASFAGSGYIAKIERVIP